MKLVINTCWGGFSLCDWARRELGYESDYSVARDDERLIEMIERFGSECISAEYSRLEVVELPEETTDYMIEEYDGKEKVIYVVGGKLKIKH